MSRTSSSQDRERNWRRPVLPFARSGDGKPLGVTPSELVLTDEPANYN
jgi:hypothetical protein